MTSSGCSITGDVVSIIEIDLSCRCRVARGTSVAVHVTRVSPSGNTSGASLVIDEISTRSDASAEPSSTMLASIEVASIWISVGTVIIGDGCVDYMYFLLQIVDKLPEMSRTVHVTIVVPNSNEARRIITYEMQLQYYQSDSINGNSNMLPV